METKTEVKTLQEVLTENNKKSRKEMHEKYARRLAELKRQQKKERINALFIGVFIVLITSYVMVLLYNQNQKDIESCVNAGHDYNYCIEKLG